MKTTTLKKTPKAPKCQICGKTLIGGVCGKLCQTRIDKGETPTTRQNALKSVQLAQPPTNWLKVAQLGRLCQNANIPISRLVRGFGGDTPNGTYNATPAIMGLVYVGKTRYAHYWWGSKTGLQTIANGGGKVPTYATPQYARNLCNPQPKTPQPPAIAQPETPATPK